MKGENVTYGFMKKIVKGLLVGDNVLPKDDEEVIALLSLAYNMIGNKAEALHLLTLSETDDILRRATGDYYSRVPDLPTGDADVLDIDHELGFVAARYIAGMISKTKEPVHVAEAERLILDYNSKVYSIFEDMKYNEEEKTCDIG